MRIDAHQHFWRYRPEDLPWIDARMQRIARDFLPADLAPARRACGVDGTIAVQARATLDETRFLLELAEHDDSIRAVVGWADLCADDVDAVLDELTRHQKLRGLRHVVQDEPDDYFLLRNDFQRGAHAVGRRGLVYDLLVYPRQLDAAVSFVAALPEQAFVLDHLGKPDIADDGLDAWRRPFTDLAQFDHVACKLSGLVTEAKWNAWRADDLRRYLDVALDAFGEDRVLFGSDWPVCLLAADDYEAVHDLVADWAAALTPSANAKLFGGNAARIYGLDTNPR